MLIYFIFYSPIDSLNNFIEFLNNYEQYIKNENDNKIISRNSQIRKYR